ncbi:CoA-disulfide reductase [Desulfobulbus oralis]|uniref:CoA-disulfide reductase n=2 Tax=Desulfobulbus oralis TaxID=1986146 RepID=A0A2L1GP15_9BACT|nr:CoA-disulfide reductase [Desulfobulbus oralis]
MEVIMAKTVIVGGVAGGASCAARLRRLDEQAEIVLLERGPYVSFANCGLPYHVGGVIPERESLIVQTPEILHERFNLDVRVQNEALAIDRKAKTVVVRDETGREYRESYDTLVLATGSSPLRPPIPGIEAPRIKTLWSVPDADEIKELLTTVAVKSAAVVGGGFIGLEMADNLHHAGLRVSIIEALDQVMAPLDYEMALLLHENIRKNQVDLHLGDAVASFEDRGETVVVHLKSGRSVEAGLVILAIGVRPNSQLARDAGLELNARGGIVVDEHLRTSDPSIYAVGDVIEVKDFVFGDRTMIPLAGPANKQGRIAANNIAGEACIYEGTQGTSVAKVFSLSAASTGANEKSLERRGLQRGRDYESIIISQDSHAGYYPGVVPLMLKLIFSRDGRKIYGAQIVGRDLVDKRIDTIATVMRLGGSVLDLARLELAYAPPYSSAKDPVNMLGFVAENLLSGKVAISAWDEPEKDGEALVLDVREETEQMAYKTPNSIEMPLSELRVRLKELDPEKRYIIMCGMGIRSYVAQRILAQNGFKRLTVYPGGVRFYQPTHDAANK